MATLHNPETDLANGQVLLFKNDLQTAQQEFDAARAAYEQRMHMIHGEIARFKLRLAAITPGAEEQVVSSLNSKVAAWEKVADLYRTRICAIESNFLTNRVCIMVKIRILREQFELSDD